MIYLFIHFVPVVSRKRYRVNNKECKLSTGKWADGMRSTDEPTDGGMDGRRLSHGVISSEFEKRIINSSCIVHYKSPQNTCWALENRLKTDHPLTWVAIKIQDRAQ